MSYPDPTQPPPFSGETAAPSWPPFWPTNDHPHPHHQPDLMSQFDHRPPFKKPRPSEKPPNFQPYPPMNSNNPRINVPNTNNINKGTSHIFYKTRMCAKFVEGTCRNGDNCTFAHGPDDLREPPPNWQEIIREKERAGGSGISNNNWSGGSGNGGDDLRMIHRLKICNKYYNGEECRYGDKCSFLHERPLPKKFMVDGNINNNGNLVEQRESSAISIGITGDVRGSGGSDLDQKVFWKTKLCSKWEMGHCPFGDRCHYAHGQSELKYPGSVDEAEQMVMNAISIPRNVNSVSTFSTTPANLGASINGDEEAKKASKWKVNKKINRIYGDWLDDYEENI